MCSEPTPIVLAFHKMMPRFSYGVTNYPPRRFEQLLNHLMDQGFSLTGDIAISFDDGYAHLAEALPPLMTRYSFRLIVFVPTGWIGRANDWDYSRIFQSTPHLSFDEIKALADIGVRFGSHGHSHTDLTSLSDDQLGDELTGSRRLLESVTGERVTDISYPFGRVDQRVLSAVESAGYERGYTMDLPTDTDEALTRGRVPVYGYDTPAAVLRRIRGSRVEALKAQCTHAFSAGTVLLNRLRGR
ncbi:polysaccharide deacetylase family protein [candidate division GN15 bacterium]|nr:polysaccharide deacetylase family protein [candidate division GN15 bacterium]